MFTYTFENNRRNSLYMQLYTFIKDDIIAGKLKTGEKLPSKRTAAKHLGVSVITVENAYAALQSEGYIDSQAKKGYYVNEISKLFVTQTQASHPILKQEALPPFRYDFSSNGMIPENFPFSVWTKLTRETYRNAKQSFMSASPAGGVPALKQALCTHLKQFRGMEVLPEQIIIGAGSEYLYSLMIQLLGGTRCYAVQSPGYAKIARIYHSVGVQSVSVPEDEAGIHIAALRESGADVAHVSPAHHYPSGTVMRISRRHELLNWANEEDSRYIIEDDYDSEFRFSGKPLPTLQSLDTAGKVIYINTFTKSLSPAIRIGYMVLPRRLVEPFYRTLGFYACTVSTFEQYTLAGFIGEGYFEKHINRMRNYYKKTRNLILEEIKNSPLAAISRVSEEKAGLHFLLKIQTQLSDHELKQRAADAGIGITCLSEYYLEPTQTVPSHIIVMNYSAIRQSDIHDAIQRLCRCIT